MVAWQQKVASWVIPLLTEYAIPDDASVQTGVDFASLDDAGGAVNFTVEEGTGGFPGLIPNYSVIAELNPTTNGIDYILKARKAVGFYGLLATVLSYEPNRINNWRFPIDRKQFGYLTISRDSKVLYNAPMSYSRQYHLVDTVISLLSNYDEQFFTKDLFNSADKLCATTYEFVTSPTVRMRFAPLPIWEVWALRWFQQQSA
jgi:hypothetical protein